MFAMIFTGKVENIWVCLKSETVFHLQQMYDEQMDGIPGVEPLDSHTGIP